MNVHTISFFGHRELLDSLRIEQCLEKLIRKVLKENEYVEFLVGREGEFDQLASSTIHRCKRFVRDDNRAKLFIVGKHHNRTRRSYAKSFFNRAIFDIADFCHGHKGDIVFSGNFCVVRVCRRESKFNITLVNSGNKYRLTIFEFTFQNHAINTDCCQTSCGEIDLILVKTPYSDWTPGMNAAVKELAQEMGLAFWDYRATLHHHHVLSVHRSLRHILSPKTTHTTL